MLKKNSKRINPILIKFASEFKNAIVPFENKDISKPGSGHYCFCFNLEQTNRDDIEDILSNLLIRHNLPQLKKGVPSPWMTENGLCFGISSVVDTNIRPFKEVQFFVHFSDAALHVPRL